MPKPYDYSKWEMENPQDLVWKAMTLVGHAAIFMAKVSARKNPFKREDYR